MKGSHIKYTLYPIIPIPILRLSLHPCATRSHTVAPTCTRLDKLFRAEKRASKSCPQELRGK